MDNEEVLVEKVNEVDKDYITQDKIDLAKIYLKSFKDAFEKTYFEFDKDSDEAKYKELEDVVVGFEVIDYVFNLLAEHWENE